MSLRVTIQTGTKKHTRNHGGVPPKAKPLKRTANARHSQCAGNTVTEIPAREEDVSGPRRDEQDVDELSRRVRRRTGITLIGMTAREQRRRIIDELAADVQETRCAPDRPCETQAPTLLAIGFLSMPSRTVCRHERDS